MDQDNVQKAKRILADWKKRRPRETPEGDVYRLLRILDFSEPKFKGSHARALHEYLKGTAGNDFGDDGGVSFVPHHQKRWVGWFDLRDIIDAAETVINYFELQTSEKKEGNNEGEN